MMNSAPSTRLLPLDSARAPLYARAQEAIDQASPSDLRQALLEGCPPDFQSEPGGSLLQRLVASFSEASITRERALGVYSEERSLRKIWMARSLLEFGADPCLLAPDGQSPLHLACSLIDRRMAGLLIAASSDLDQPNAEGQTPLMVASSLGRSLTARALLEAGALPDAPSPNARGPLHQAALFQDGALAKALIFHRANACARDPEGLLPWQISESVCGSDSPLTQLLFQAFVASERDHIDANCAEAESARRAASLSL